MLAKITQIPNGLLKLTGRGETLDAKKSILFSILEQLSSRDTCVIVYLQCTDCLECFTKTDIICPGIYLHSSMKKPLILDCVRQKSQGINSGHVVNFRSCYQARCTTLGLASQKIKLLQVTNKHTIAFYWAKWRPKTLFKLALQNCGET